jgi:hypothetical protein
MTLEDEELKAISLILDGLNRLVELGGGDESYTPHFGKLPNGTVGLILDTDFDTDGDELLYLIHSDTWRVQTGYRSKSS